MDFKQTIKAHLDKMAQQDFAFADKIVAFVKRHMKTIKAYNEGKVQLKKAA
jgi:hypothetical protein